MSVMMNAVTLGWALAALFFVLGLGKAGSASMRQNNNVVAAGALVLGGTALYAADIMNMPEIAGALVIGAAIGLLLARELPLRLMPQLGAALGGCTGMALACAALAIRRNPYAFGLFDETSGGIGPWHIALLVVALLAGIMAAGASVCRPRSAGAGAWLLVLSLALLATAGFALFCLGQRMIWLAAGLLCAAPAGSLVGATAQAKGDAARWAAIGGLAGWAAAAVGFLLENPGCIFAGGLAGAGGTLLAARLSVGLSGKGLADERRHA